MSPSRINVDVELGREATWAMTNDISQILTRRQIEKGLMWAGSAGSGAKHKRNDLASHQCLFAVFLQSTLGIFCNAELQMHCSDFGKGTRGISPPTEVEAILGHALGCRIQACCDFHWLSMKHRRMAFCMFPPLATETLPWFIALMWSTCPMNAAQ